MPKPSPLARNLRLAGLLALGVLFLAQEPARADTLEFIPESHHQQYQTFGLFPEDHTSLLWINGGRGWGGIAGALAVVGSEEYHTQLIAFASANAAYRISPTEAELLTETIDARVGLQLEHSFDESNRILVGWTHWSGHISDNVEDPALIGPNLGDEMINIRYVHDFPQLGRVGATLRPFFVSDPPMKAFAADQFAEWYPFGVSADIHAATPYLAAGLEEYGPQDVNLTFHGEAGVFFGEHLGPHHTTQIRFAAGLYSGNDPRMKYMQFLDSRETFGYLGALVDL